MEALRHIPRLRCYLRTYRVSQKRKRTNDLPLDGPRHLINLAEDYAFDVSGGMSGGLHPGNLA